jgi:hypothetical protein
MNVSKDLLFEITAGLRAATLAITCRVWNMSSAPIGLFARIPETFPDGSLKLSANSAYITLLNDVLQVGRYLLPVPEPLKVAVRHVPLAMIVAPRAMWEEEIHLPIPVRVCQPYQRALMVGANPGANIHVKVPKIARRLEVTLGVFPFPEELTMIPISPEYPTIYKPWPPGQIEQVLLTREIAMSADVKVLDYGAEKAE